MHTGQPNPQSRTKDCNTGKIVLDSTTKHYVFPALKVSNNFATIGYDAHVNFKIDYTINHIFRSMTVQERNQLLTILAMSVQIPQLAGFLLTGNRTNFLYVEGLQLGYMTVLIFYHLYTKLTVALIEFLYITKIPLCI